MSIVQRNDDGQLDKDDRNDGYVILYSEMMTDNLIRMTEMTVCVCVRVPLCSEMMTDNSIRISEMAMCTCSTVQRDDDGQLVKDD